MEFCGVKGEHFTKLGSEGGGCGDNGKAKGSTSDDKKIREMGPLEKKALDKHKKMQKENVFEIDSEVSSILANDELRSILLDPQMQQIMEECSTGNKLRYYMSHEEYGPKLRKLMEVGLIQVA